VAEILVINGTSRRFRHIVLVANGQAGALLGQESCDSALEAALREAAHEVDIVPPEAGELPDRMRMARDMGADCIVVAGGDGTVACAAACFAGTPTILGLIPCGTMNLLARDLRLDPADRDGSARNLAQGEARAIDVGEVAGADGEAHVFLCASMLGTPARLSRYREEGRQRGNGLRAWAGFGWAAGRALLQNHSLRMSLRCNGQVLKIRTPSLTITVNALDDGAGHLFGRSVLDGGELVLYVVRRGSVLGQARLLLRTMLTGNLHAPEIDMIRTSEVVVSSRHAALHVLVDGELRLLKPPLRYTIKPRALTVLAAPP
jgi:diacylglycerol kinase family enzyme